MALGCARSVRALRHGPMTRDRHRSPGRWPTRSATRVLATVAIGVTLLWGTSGAVLAGGILPGNNPKANIEPSPDFYASGQCSSAQTGWSCQNPCITSRLSFPTYSNQPACIAYVVSAVTAARKAEDVGPMVLPSNWYSLTPAQQLFVLADLERTARGLPPYLGINAALTAAAQRAAESNTDPSLAPGFAAGVDPQGYYGMGGTWASGFSTVGADYFWMYADGWGGSPERTSNQSCTSAAAPACWAHRDELLGFDPSFNPGVGLGCRTCEMGTGFAAMRGYSSFTDLVELPAGAPPPMTFTWSRDVLPYLPKSAPATSKGKGHKPPAKHTVPKRTGPSTAWRLTTPPAAPWSLCLGTNVHSRVAGRGFECRSHAVKGKKDR